MRGANMVLIFIPLIILWLLVPAFKATTFPPIIVGGVIGLYFGLSVIGVYELGYSYVTQRLSEKDEL